MSSTVEQIKERLDIADVVGSYVHLEKAGSNFKARCPFHNEKTPSFFVSPARQTYHCFGCNRGGDIFSFIEEIEGVDFYGALKILAEKAGVEITRFSKKYASENEALFSVMEDAAVFFERSLRNSSDAIDYLKSRGVEGKTAKVFRLGFAPCTWDELTRFLRSKGHSEKNIERAGLAISGKRGLYDRFRCRVMFPLSDSSGRVVAFSGRILESVAQRHGEKTDAKYVNSPETPLFNKSRILYGLDKAKMEIRKKGYCVLVEGQMDIVMSHQAEVKNTVAASGTALTTEHLDVIKRFASEIVVAFDADSAGFAASKRAIDEALARGFEVKIALLPKGSDPADIIVSPDGPEKWRELIEGAVHIIEFFMAAVKENARSDRELKVRAGEEVVPYIARLANKMEQAHFVSFVANAVGVSEEVIWEEVARTTLKENEQADAYETESHGAIFDTKDRRAVIERKVLGVLFLSDEDSSAYSLPSGAKESYKKIVGDEHFNTMMNLSEEDKKAYMIEAEVYYEGVSDLSREYNNLLLYLEEEVLKDRLAEAMERVRVCEKENDSDTVNQILKECQAISKRINEIKHLIQ